MAAASSAQAAPGAEAPAPPPPPGATRLDPEHPVWVDAAKGRVAVDGSVCLREGVLEMFACPRGTKEHESIVAVDSPAFLLHTALLAVGAEPGRPARFQPEFRPPEGPRIEVTVAWVADGETRTATAQSWIRDVDSGEAMRMPFVFGGSGFWTDPDSGRQRYLAEAGDLICVSNFGTAMLDVPAESTQANGALLFEPFTERIPPLGTPVRVWLAPKTEPTAAAAAPAAGGVALAIDRVGAAGASGASTDGQRDAWRRLAASSPGELIDLLRAIDGASPTARNWLRTAFDAASERLRGEGSLPLDELRRFAGEPGGGPLARRAAFEAIRSADDAAAAAMLDGLLNDPSLELRYDAVARLLERADGADEAERTGLYRRAFEAARSLPQIEEAARRLGELGEEVDLADSLGFITAWRLIGPFDNRGGGGFAVAYPPEAALDAAAAYEGMPAEADGEPPEVRWESHRTDDRLGKVDVNEAVGPFKGAVAYAWTTLASDAARDVELRYTTTAATKLWLNGEPINDHEVYHNGEGFDQHRVAASLRRGENELLLKVCQNEQTQPWAQDWAFQLRVSDALGGAVSGVEAAGVAAPDEEPPGDQETGE